MRKTEQNYGELPFRGYDVVEVLDRLPCGVFIKDLSGRFLWVNATLCRILNLSSAEIVGRRDCDFFGQIEAHWLLRAETSIVCTGKPVAHRFEVACRGQRLELEATRAPVKDYGGVPYAMVGLVRKVG